MRRVFQIAAVMFVAALATGCATNTQIDELKAQVQAASAEAAEANERSKAAEATANRAEQTANDTNSKLNRMFKKSMMK